MKMRVNHSSYFESFKQIVIKREEMSKKNIKTLRENGLAKEEDGSVYSFLASDFRVLTVGEIILNKDYKKAKEYFYLSAKMNEYLLNLITKGDEQISTDFASLHEYKAIYLALLSDNYELARSIAKLLGGRPEIEKDDFEVFYIAGYLLKYLILGEEKEASPYLAKLESQLTRKNNIYYLALLEIFRAIYNHDEKEIAAGFNKLLKGHRVLKDFKKSENEFLSIEGLGILKLLQNRGIYIVIEDDLLPLKLFEDDELNYPEIDYFVK
ncbi:MAG TPA: hypothetical protein PLK32_08400 [Defluviitoga tunisiensis]|nr:hypothetical protein [Defluviitoga tunisiensis]